MFSFSDIDIIIIFILIFVFGKPKSYKVIVHFSHLLPYDPRQVSSEVSVTEFTDTYSLVNRTVA